MSGLDLVSEVYVVPPVNQSKNVGRRESEHRKFLADVKEARTASLSYWDETYTEEKRSFNEGESMGIKIKLSEKYEDADRAMYAYLKPSSGATADMFAAAPYNFILGMDNPEGIPVENTDEIEGMVMFLDGLATPGLTISFEVVLSYDQFWDGTDETNKRIKGYASTKPNVKVYNVEPTILDMEMNNLSAEENAGGNNGKFANKLPMGQTQRFKAIVDDPGTYDLENTVKPFKVMWTAMLSDGTTYDDPVEKPGNPEDNLFEYAFPAAGEWKVSAKVMDKDMKRWSAVTYTVYVTVLDQPAVEQTPGEEMTLVERLNYNDSDNRKFTVGVGYWDPKYTGELTVIVQVKSMTPAGKDPGLLEFDAGFRLSAADAEARLNALADPEHPYDANSDYYLVTLNKTTLAQALAITAMDGTDYSSIYGFRIQSFVVNDDMLPTSHAAANAYYLTSQPTTIFINNLEPEIGANTTQENTNSWKVSGGAATQYPIKWQVKYDVDRDWTELWADGSGPGIKITFSGCQNAEAESKFITEAQSGTFVPNFGSAQGDQIVTMTIEDKDGGTVTFTYLYTVEPSKFLKTLSTGPSGGTTTSSLSQKYYRMNARGGLGQGHTFVADATFSTAENFELAWNCGKQTYMSAYAFGYRFTDAPTMDNNTLNGGMDIGIDINGNQNGDRTLTNWYVYNPTDGKDSYFYLWILTTLDENGAASDIVLGNAISPEVAGPPGKARIPLPTAQTEDGAYLDTIAEAIFSKEWKVEDNLGDINQDGIPDTFAVTVWGSGESLIRATTGLENVDGDLVDIAAGNPDEDYLPGVYAQDSTSLLQGNYQVTIGGITYQAGAKNSYAPVGIAFNNRMEIRGLHEGLNETVLTRSEPSFSKDEQKAWEVYAAANGLDPVADLSFENWTPEPRGTGEQYRMDPTMDDTDSDGFPDGWEYFFWYQAKVWAPAGADLGKPKGGQHFVFERFNPLNIIIGTEIPAGEVMERFNPCVPYEREEYDGPKWLKNDFDHDGLTDLEELVIGTNPCHWDTDGDRLSDAWEVMTCLDPLNGSKNGNPDGDFMAFHSVRLDMCWIDPADAANYAMEIAMAGEGLPEDVRIYGLPGLRMGIDYDIDATGRYVMLQTMDVVSYSFNPKWLGGEQLTYGIRPDDIPMIIPPDWVWGWFMVDNVVCETIHLNAGDEIFPNLEFVLIHDQVRDGFGFDPRTGWHVNGNGYVVDRWDPAVNDNISILDQTGVAVNTRAYANYDEYLVMKYRVDYGLDYSPMTTADGAVDPNDENVWNILRTKTTNPNVVRTGEAETDAEGETAAEGEGEEGEGGAEGTETAANETQPNAAGNISSNLAAAFNSVGSDKSPITSHGADTDGDGVPDGWELYMYRNPNGAADPDDEDGLGLPMQLDFDGDELSYALEYAGTDSCNAYKDCASIYANHPGNKSKWFNKFFPTNPGTMKLNDANGTTIFAGFGNADGADTDLDGVTDALEGSAWNAVFANGGNQVVAKLGFVYGNPTDDGLTVCFRGGGMNPCTIDTDLDGIPDGWEMQHPGVPVQLPGKTVIDPEGGEAAGIELDAATFIADGINNAANLPEAVYLAGGMDATWKGDAVFSDINDPDLCLSWDDLLGTRRDVDFDHDGLQNYQEYLTQSIRHFRYDDITTPLMGRQLEEGTYDPFTSRIVDPHTQSFGDSAGGHDGTGTGYPVFDPADPATFAANAAEAWNGRSFIYYQTVTTGVREVVKHDPYTGAPISTNRIYYTAQKKMARPGASLAAKHVASGGTALQYAWTTDGWREAGYFAPARRDWDRAIASKELASPIYMWPITGSMVGNNSSIAGYATTDPRISDTDGDGMDDFYEMYHGLNPLLGTTPATADQTDWGLEILEGKVKFGDIVSAQFWVAGYPLADSRPTFNAWYNEWMYPRYSGLLGRAGSNPGDEVGGPIQAPQAYDPVLYPWGMGTSMVDADGDGVRNDEERILANVADPVGRHTDPSPLWFTERTTPASYVAQYYVQSPMLAYMPWTPSPLDSYEEAAQRVMTDATTDIYFGGGVSYQYSFEENEGYDTDGDMTPDEIEFVSTVRKSSDPLRFDDPARSQAFYLPGENSYAVSRDLHIRPIDSVDFLKQFTVECWVLPEKKGAAQTILDRAVAYEGNSINTDKLAIRSNFRIGLDAQGKVYGMFDNNDSIESGLDAPKSCQFVDGGPLPLNEWSHIALTFDGSTLMIYVNGVIQDSAPTQLIPANGVTLINQDTAATNGFMRAEYRCDPSALLIGARPKKQNLYALYPYYIEGGMHMESFDNLQEYFQGYVDEVRVWDGARTGAQISENFRKMIGFTQASENRDEVFESWYYNNGSRNNNDGNPTLPPELVLNYDFSTLPGAVNEPDVAKTPAGFTKNVLYAAMSDYSSNGDIDTTGLYPNLLDLKGVADGGVEGDLRVGWWNETLVHSTVYDDYHVVPWIKNTVSHLPLIDGGAVDSFMYGDQFGSVYMSASDLGVAKLVFPNTAMPYPSTVFNNDRYYRLAHAMILAERRGESFNVALGKSRFQVRNNFIGTADLVPMGGAFAKTCKKMWNNGASDPWEQTRDDTNGDGIPDWWEEYARHNYAADLDPALAIGWDTMIDYHGARIPAGKAYVIDIYRGMQPDGTIDLDYAVNTDEDGDNLPDWWENLFGVAKYGADDDPDNDGLSNYDEYLFSFGATPYGMENGFPFLDPARQRSGSGQKVTDYFLAGLPDVVVSADGSVTNIFANQYLGEIATDHDFMEGWWEKTFSNSYANQYVYDPDKDTDGDGWDNFSENRAATWYGTLLSDSITRYLSDQVVLNNYPQPAIGLRFTYNGGIQDVSGKSVVVRTMTKANGRTDATFTVVAPEASNVGVVAYTPGAFIDAKTPIHGFLQPGSILPQSCYIYGVHLSKEGVYFWGIPTTIYRPTAAGNTYPASSGTYISNMTLTTGNGAAVECWYFTGSFTDYIADVRAYGRDNVMLDNPALDFELIGKAVSRDDGRRGDAVIMSAQTAVQTSFGSFNFLTGEFILEPAALESAGLQPDGMLVKLEYEYAISAEWPQTLWLNQPTIGRVKQGLNTIEAWMDLNGDGAYTAGEPYGVIRNVNIGWHKTAEMVLELKDTSTIIPHYLLSDGSSDRAVIEGVAGGVTAAAAEGGEGGGEGNGLTAKVAVRRVSINGQRMYGLKTVPSRTLVSKSYILDDRAYLTEADVLSDDKFDLDWKWLVSDAAKLGLAVSDINTVEYEIDRVNTLGDGSVTNIAIATFVNSFGRQRPVPVTRAPLAAAPVYSAAPTFSWTCSDNTMTAFRLQVSTSTNAADIVYDTGIKQLPGSDSLTVGTFGYSFTAPIYAGAPIVTNGAPVFLDGSNYFWRVTEFNAKYNDVDPKFWSSWTQFQIDVVNANINPRLPTGYGKCGAIVRYYGANTNDLAGLVVVEAHQSADFAGQPLAQMRADVSQLADRDDLQTTNAEFAGIEPGTVYLMAYIDANNNGKRDVNESWGYANYVGTEALSLFTPQGVKVTDEILRSPSVVIYIEDTDFNRNEILDCIETTLAAAAGGTEVSAGDGDRDGLLDEEEDGFATDSSVWDTDGDGMPDGWEVKFADLDPTFFDAVEAADSDVMAFVTNTCTIVTVQNTDGSEAVNYILKDNGNVPIRGDSIEGYELYEIYDYPIATEDGLVNCYGRGALVTNLTADAGTTNRVMAISSGMVALVHAQVYEEFGFNPKTANPTAYADETAVNTKPFTALDKYLLIRYFAALGICDEDDVNVNGKWSQYSLKPFDIDNDKDGAPDGWELYVMFGTNAMDVVNFTNGTAISAWNFDDRESDDDGDNLPLVREFEGAAPTDPWNAHTISSAFTDFDAWKYGLKPPEAQLSDGDNDGLSNIQEYRALPYGLDLNVAAMKTDGETIDYFRTVTIDGQQYYIGELVADHDFMEDYLEDEHGYDRGLYDATKDADKDGWSNWAELRSYVSAGVEYVADIISNRVIRSNLSVEERDIIRNNYDVIEDTTEIASRYDDAGNLIGSTTTGSIIYFDTQAVLRAQSLYSGTPYPTVKLTIAYDGEKDIDAGGIVVEAYSSSKMQKKLCWWNLTAADFSSKFAHNGYITLELKTPDHGYLKEGTTHFAVFADMDSSGAYNGAEPFGIAKDVEIGYDRATEFTVELKDITPVVPRIDFVSMTSDRTTLEGTTTNTSNVVWGEVVAAAGDGTVQQQGGFTVDGEEVRVRVIRTAINGDDTAKKRTLLNRVYTIANRSYIHEGDFFTSMKNDLDPYLAVDAKAIGIAPANISEATYEVVLGDAKYKAGSTNANEGVIATFINSYPKARATGVPLAPSANSEGVLTTSQAKFRFAADTSTYSAYVLQVSEDENFAGALATTNLLTGAIKGEVTAKPAWYFEDGKTYYWRVALMNGKYTTLDKLSDADVVWSDTAEFSVDLRGEATANVNYFGPAETDGKIVVEAYLSPDFVGDPIARVEGGSLVDGTNAILVAGLPSGKLYLLAFVDRNGDGVRQSYESWGYACKVGTLDTDLWTPVPVTVNAETLGDPVVADIYIEDTDINQNFSVDPLDDEADLKAAEEVIASESADDSASDISDRDGDGLKGNEEDELGTDPDNVDSDGDGMWDGWEAAFAGTDPLSPEDATDAAEGDVMAYKEIQMTVVRTRSTETGLEAIYILPEGMDKPTVGDNMNGKSLYLAYEYGKSDLFGIGVTNEVPTSAEYQLATVVNDREGTTGQFLFTTDVALGVGTNVTDYVAFEAIGPVDGLYTLGPVTNLVVDTTLIDPTSTNVVDAVESVQVSLGTNRVIKVIASAKVALVHNQVYQKFGYSSKTAVGTIPENERINTKPFTALDKYLLIRYFAAQGLCDEKTVNATCDWAAWSLKPGVIDGDWGDADGRYGDGIADGWELYVGTSPWNFDDRELDDDGDGLPLYREYDAGHVPTSPWAKDTDGDGIPDDLAWLYHLKGTDGIQDFDGDGLSNYAEYLLAEVFEIAAFDPDDAFSVQEFVSDYFYKVGQLYVGDVFTDHDRISDQWERGYLAKSSEVSPYAYDADFDPDGDGWSNFSEFQTGTDPTKTGALSVDAIEMDEYPVPTVELTVTYLGAQLIAGVPIVVKAWRDQAMTSKPDAVWTLGGQGEVSVLENGNSNVVTGVKYFGMNPMREMLLHLSPGSVVPGSVEFEFKDLAWILYDMQSEQGYVSDPATAIWEGSIIDQPRNGDLTKGDIVRQGDPDVSFGTIDYASGELNVDFSAFPDWYAIVGDISQQMQGNNWLSVYNLQKSYVRVNWQSKLIVGGTVATYFLSEADMPSPENNSLGHLKEGFNTFIAFYDLNQDGKLTPGEPFGFARDVDVGWNYAKAAIELTDTSAVSPRYDLTKGGTSGTTGDDNGNATSSAATDRETIWEASADDVYDYLVGDKAQGLGGSAPALHAVRVRVARIAVDGFDIEAVSNALNTAYMATLYDRVLDLSATGRPVLTEADILSDPRNEFDIDWNAAAETSQNTLQGLTQYYALTNVYYGVFVGNGLMESSNVTNGTMLAKVFARKYPEDDATYTAFKIRIKSGNTTIWTSDLELMPPRDAEGYHTWTPPIRVGAIVPGGTAEFRNGVKYTWEIAIYNAKYQVDPTAWAKSPSGGEFYMNALTASPDYATVNVAVRYFGPSAVVNKNYPIRVQAFTTPDFSGEPVGEGYVADKTTLSSTDEPTTANARIVGLPQGIYYIRAFFDAVNDATLTTWPYSEGHWESWGCYCTRDTTTGTIFSPKSIVIGPDVGASETIAVYIDDCDTDQDTLPDIWEFATKGNLTTLSATSIDQVAAGFAMKKELTGALQVHGDVTEGLEVKLNSARVAALMLNVDATGDTNEELAEALAGAADNESAEPTSVVITGIEFDRETGKVTVVADTEGTKTGSTPASQIYEFPEGSSALKLTLKLWYNASLDQANWVEVGAKEISIDKTSGTYTYDIGDTLDLSNGFFKVSLEK